MERGHYALLRYAIFLLGVGTRQIWAFMALSLSILLWARVRRYVPLEH